MMPPRPIDPKPGGDIAVGYGCKCEASDSGLTAIAGECPIHFSTEKSKFLVGVAAERARILRLIEGYCLGARNDEVRRLIGDLPYWWRNA